MREEISECFKSPIGPGDEASQEGTAPRTIIGAVAPHAGYVYSGPVAAHLYSRLSGMQKPSTVVILGPNHTGLGAGLALGSDEFLTPLGTVKVDGEMIADLVGDLFTNDSLAHTYEHSIEVQLPFLQYIGWDSKIVPICVGVHDYEILAEAASRIRKVIGGRKDVLVIASSDMSHYIPAKVAKDIDMKAIDCMLALDSKRLYQAIMRYNITMCGFGPAIIMMEAVGGSKATLLKYATSGDIQPMAEVVGYASIAVE